MSTQTIVATGSYTTGEGRGPGIRLLSLDREELTASTLAEVALDDPTFLLWSPDGSMLYAVHETSPTVVTALRVDATGASAEVAGSLELTGSGGCHVAFGIAASTLIVTDYGSGTVEVVGLDADGAPTQVIDVCDHSGYLPQRTAHPHQATILPGTGLLGVTDLGLDRVYLYRQQPSGEIDLAGEITAGRFSGPRHLAADHESLVLYLACELTGEITDAVRSAAGGDGEEPSWTVRRPLPASGTGVPNEVSHLEISGHENHLFVANRGPDTLAAFNLGMMRPELVAEVPVGARPRHFTRLEDLILVAAQDGDRIDLVRWNGHGFSIAGEPIPAPSISCIVPRP